MADGDGAVTGDGVGEQSLGLLDTGDGQKPEGKYESGDWRNNLATEWQGHTAIENMNSQDDLVKSFIHSQSLIGVDKADIIRRPKENATPEQIREFNTAMGVPDTGDGYAFQPEDHPEIFGDPTAEVKAMKDYFVELGVEKGVGDKILARHFEGLKGIHEKSLELIAENAIQSDSNLRQKYGEAYVQNMAIAKEALKQFDSAKGPFAELIKATGLNTNEHFIDFMYEVGKRGLDDKFLGGSGGTARMDSPAEAQSQLKSLMSDPAFVSSLQSNDKNVADQANEKRNNLLKSAYPEQ